MKTTIPNVRVEITYHSAYGLVEALDELQRDPSWAGCGGSGEGRFDVKHVWRKERLVAVAYGKDGVTGDSQFYPPDARSGIKATLISTFAELLAAWKKQDAVEMANFPSDKPNEEPIGFWLVTERDLRAICVVFEDAEDDGSTYCANRAAKRICARLAVRTVGK